MFTLILLHFVPCSQIAKLKLKIQIHIEITLKRNVTFAQLIDKTCVYQITATARAAQAGQAIYARAWFREPRL